MRSYAERLSRALLTIFTISRPRTTAAFRLSADFLLADFLTAGFFFLPFDFADEGDFSRAATFTLRPFPSFDFTAAFFFLAAAGFFRALPATPARAASVSARSVFSIARVMETQSLRARQVFVRGAFADFGRKSETGSRAGQSALSSTHGTSAVGPSSAA